MVEHNKRYRLPDGTVVLAQTRRGRVDVELQLFDAINGEPLYAKSAAASSFDRFVAEGRNYARAASDLTADDLRPVGAELVAPTEDTEPPAVPCPTCGTAMFRLVYRAAVVGYQCPCCGRAHPRP